LRVHGDQEECEGDEEKNHREVIAVRDRIHRKEDRKPALGRTLFVGVEGQEATGNQRDVKRIHLGDDRLGPERVGNGQDQPGNGAGGKVGCQERREIREQPHGEPATHR
jgi:hypothetical protein